MKRLVILVALLSICGCTNPMLVDIHNGTYCNSSNVEAYAEKHEITYAQALEELRRQSDEIWLRKDDRAKADVVNDKSTDANNTDAAQKWR